MSRMPNNGHPPPGTKIISNYTYPNIKGYKKIDAEEYKLLERDYRNNLEFRSFPSDGVWTVQTKKSSKSTTKICDIKKVKDLPELYPLVDLALRKDDISHALIRFSEMKKKSLLEFGECTYSAHELSEFIIQYLVSQELGGGSKKILVEKKWIKVNNEYEESRLTFRNNF